MSTINLRLKVTDGGTTQIQVFLGSVSPGNLVKGWSGANPTFTKDFPGLQIPGSTLDVFIMCNGFGSSAVCEVISNGTSRGSVKANFNDPTAAKKTFTVSP